MRRCPSTAIRANSVNSTESVSVNIVKTRQSATAAVKNDKQPTHTRTRAVVKKSLFHRADTRSYTCGIEMPSLSTTSRPSVSV